MGLLDENIAIRFAPMWLDVRWRLIRCDGIVETSLLEKAYILSFLLLSAIEK